MTSPILSRQYASQLLFEVSISKIYQRIVFVGALLVVLAVFSLEYSFIIYLVLFTVLALLVSRAIKNNQNFILQWQPDGQWMIEQAGNVKQSAMLQSGSVVTPFFAALNFKLDNQKKLNIVLFKDNIDAEKFRQLRVRLKVEGIKPRVEVSTLSDN